MKLFVDIICFIFLLIPTLLRDICDLLYFGKKNVKGKLVLVTGAGRGMGRSVSLKLSKLGCRVAVVDIDEKTAKATAEEIRKQGGDAFNFQADVSDLKSVEQLRSEVSIRMGSVDILINNAGLIPDMSVEEQPPGFDEKLVKVNVLGTFYMTETFLEQMKQNNEGHIVAISSMSALHPSPYMVLYSATKAGVRGYMLALIEKLRLEGWSTKIKTTTIYPAYVNTRQDLNEFLSLDIRCPLIDTEDATDEIISAILREQPFATIPFYYKPLMSFVNILPLRTQQLIMDYLVRECDFKKTN